VEDAILRLGTALSRLQQTDMKTDRYEIKFSLNYDSPAIYAYAADSNRFMLADSRDKKAMMNRLHPLEIIHALCDTDYKDWAKQIYLTTGRLCIRNENQIAYLDRGYFHVEFI
jgi:hypothetical protein